MNIDGCGRTELVGFVFHIKSSFKDILEVGNRNNFAQCTMVIAHVRGSNLQLIHLFLLWNVHSKHLKRNLNKIKLWLIYFVCFFLICHENNAWYCNATLVLHAEFNAFCCSRLFSLCIPYSNVIFNIHL